MGMDPHEITKVIEGVYKNILENFNPCSKEMILTGKAYLKALHGASAASTLYLEALGKVSKVAQDSSLGCSTDIGASLMEVTEAFREIHSQHLNTLKAFYVDFLVPLETNLEKDIRVIQNEQKKFLMNHKNRLETFSKASSAAKKLKKKGSTSKKNSSSATIDKEIKIMQELEEEKSKLETFCEKSLSEALTQERRRYGFILERQASLGKHYFSFYSSGQNLLNLKLENWMKISKTRELLPETMQHMLLQRIQKGSEEDCIYCTPRNRSMEEPITSSGQQHTQLRKTKSMETSEILGTYRNESGDVGEHGTFDGDDKNDIEDGRFISLLSRAKSDLNLQHQRSNSPPSYASPINSRTIGSRPKTLGISVDDSHCSVLNGVERGNIVNTGTNNGIVKALYAYLSSGDNQLTFLEGDVIALIGERSKGWQFGENLRTQKHGWFPIAYTESSPSSMSNSPLLPNGLTSIVRNNNNAGSTTHFETNIKSPTLLPPPPSSDIYNSSNIMYHSNRPQSMVFLSSINKCGSQQLKSTLGPLNIVSTSTQTSSNIQPPPPVSSDSLHSSNDSGFSNDVKGQHGSILSPSSFIPLSNQNNTNEGNIDVPPQPEIDYSDDEPSSNLLLQNISPNSPQQRTKNIGGDRWLMNKYQMLETARINGNSIQNPEQICEDNNEIRRSQSHKNICLYDKGNCFYNEKQIRGRPLERRILEQSSMRQNPIRRESSNDGGALKRFLSRTKSLIWKRGESSPPTTRKNYPQSKQGRSHFKKNEYLSRASSTSSIDLWMSHASLIDSKNWLRQDQKAAEDKVIQPPMNNQPSSKCTKDTGGIHKQNQKDMSSERRTLNNDGSNICGITQNITSVKNQACQTDDVRGIIGMPPPLPPPLPNSNEIKKHGKNCNMLQSNGKNQNGSLKRSESEKIRRELQKDHLSRVESFSGSEAPIIPSHNNRKSPSKIQQCKSTIVSSKGSLNSDSFEDEDEINTEVLEDGQSSIYIEEDEDFPQESKSEKLTSNSYNNRRIGNSLRIHGRRMNKNGKCELLLKRIDSPDSKMSSIIDPEEFSTTMNRISIGRRNNGFNSSHNSPNYRRPNRKFTGSIRSEVRTIQLITSSGDNLKRNKSHIYPGKSKNDPIFPLFEYGTELHKRLYYPEGNSRIDQKSERSGNLVGPWYDIFGVDSSVINNPI